MKLVGSYFEDFVVGETVEHTLTRTVTDADRVLFSSLTMNLQQIHLDAQAMEQTDFGRPLVNGSYTLGLVIGISVLDLSFGTTIANLGMREVRFPNPVFAGDTISCSTTIVDKRRSKSRPDAGIVTFEHRGLKNGSTLVCIVERSTLIRARESHPEESLRESAPQHGSE